MWPWNRQAGVKCEVMWRVCKAFHVIMILTNNDNSDNNDNNISYYLNVHIYNIIMSLLLSSIFPLSKKSSSRISWQSPWQVLDELRWPLIPMSREKPKRPRSWVHGWTTPFCGQAFFILFPCDSSQTNQEKHRFLWFGQFHQCGTCNLLADVLGAFAWKDAGVDGVSMLVKEPRRSKSAFEIAQEECSNAVAHGPSVVLERSWKAKSYFWLLSQDGNFWFLVFSKKFWVCQFTTLEAIRWVGSPKVLPPVAVIRSQRRTVGEEKSARLVVFFGGMAACP